MTARHGYNRTVPCLAAHALGQSRPVWPRRAQAANEVQNWLQHQLRRRLEEQQLAFRQQLSSLSEQKTAARARLASLASQEPTRAGGDCRGGIAVFSAGAHSSAAPTDPPSGVVGAGGIEALGAGSQFLDMGEGWREARAATDAETRKLLVAQQAAHAEHDGTVLSLFHSGALDAQLRQLQEQVRDAFQCCVPNPCWCARKARSF